MIFAGKVSRIYPYLHLALLSSCFLWYRLGQGASKPQFIVLCALLAYAVMILFLGWLDRQKYFSSKNVFFVHGIFDAAIIAAVVRFTGGYNSEFYLAFFPAVTLASVVAVGWRSLSGAFWYGLCYFSAVYPASVNPAYFHLVAFRMASIWGVGLVTYAISHSMHSSEAKLLRTLDVLNERTWELENSQTQLSSIYETTRALSGILDLDSLLQEILSVAERIFRLQKCQVFLSNVTGDCLYLYASLSDGNKRIYEKPAMHVRDITPLVDLNDRTSVIKQLNYANREAGTDNLDVPLISRGKIMGIMRIVTEKRHVPSDRERRLLMIFANSAAVAIDNSLLHRKTEELTITDALTELFNYRYFRNKLSDELRRADRYRQRFSLLMLDLDHFKKVNDAYGHQTGNIVLREVSGIIKQCVRDVDIVARYGGEEFVVILPQTGDHDALTIAERIRSAIEKAFFSNALGQRDVQITISIGVASYPDGVHTIDQLLEKVDKVLYEAKADGRNRVRMADRLKRKTADIGL